MDTAPFDFFSVRRLVFGPGRISRLPEIAFKFGRNIMLVTGRTSFSNSPQWEALNQKFAAQDAVIHHVSVTGEPSPEDVDTAVEQYKNAAIDIVVSIGGGSVIDAGKAISAMIRSGERVIEYLEGVGTRSHPGDKLPFIAVPTTSGTGSEATKNAVISRPGPHGFKKSLRHDNFVPDIALVDPALTLNCPPGITAACGMDALTQLIEAYVSTRATAMTDALCRSGLEGFGAALETCVQKAPDDLASRTRMSYGAYLSGLGLAHAGLGVVHGVAGVIGGISRMSHGLACGTLLAAVTRATIESLRQTPASSGFFALEKYADAARLLGLAQASHTTDAACSALVKGLYNWEKQFDMPRLSAAGIAEKDIEQICDAAGQKNNPAILSRETLVQILSERL